jgi:hypothetical protein
VELIARPSLRAALKMSLVPMELKAQPLVRLQLHELRKVLVRYYGRVHPLLAS